jgi:hypothetical protein
MKIHATAHHLRKLGKIEATELKAAQSPHGKNNPDVIHNFTHRFWGLN